MSEIVIGQQYLGSTLGDRNNSVLVSLGDNLSGDTESSYAQLYQQVGFCSLPPNSEPGKESAECITLIDGTRKVVFGTRHVNSQNLYANMNPGDTIIYGSGPDGTTKSRIKANGTTQTCSMQTVDSDNKDVQFSISPTALSFFAPWGKMVFDATGFHITTISGPSFHIGSVGGLPSIPGLNVNNVCSINCDVIRINGSAVQLGAGNVYAPLVISATPSLPGVPLTHPDLLVSVPGVPAPGVPVSAITSQGVQVAIS